MNRTLIFVRLFTTFLLLLEAYPCLALENSDSIRGTVTLGTGVLFEKNNDAMTETTRLPLALGPGLRYRMWAARFEYSFFKTADGNSTVSVTREHESAIFWGAYEFASVDGWLPYVAVGTGLGRTAVSSRVAGSVDSAQGAWDGMFAAAAGFRANWMPRLGVRPEIRYESADSYKTKDARWGVFLQLDFLY